MQTSMVSLAAEAFRTGNYVVALDFYRRLSETLGEANFRANIRLCGNRLQSLGRRECTALPLRQIKVACVMDEFTFHSYEPECDLLQLTPENAVNELENFVPDLLFIESAWRGKDELWNRKIATLSRELRDVLQWCKERQVPTIFWNKEDPVHFETFLTTAQQFDFVFTTDIDCIARYKAALGHERVYLLPFACQPKTHNPIELYPRKDAFCFAGAYYVRYQERTRDLENYVAEFPKFRPLEIFDRNYGKDDVNYMFPPEYQPYIVGTLPFNEIDKAYKGYRYSINLNSIKQSQTMFARRVYELLGSNTITVSNFSRGVRLMFGDLVIASDSGKEIVSRLQALDEEGGQKFRLAGLRKVMLEHTYEHRMAYVASKALGWQRDAMLPAIVVIAKVSTEGECRCVIDNFTRQKYEYKQLVLLTDLDIPAELLKECAADIVRPLNADGAGGVFESGLITGDLWVAQMVGADYYGPNYLLDLAIATSYSDAKVIGKSAHYTVEDDRVRLSHGENAYHQTSSLPKRSSVIRGDALATLSQSTPWFEGYESESWQLPGIAIDPFNYCRDGQCVSDLTALAHRVDDLQLDSGVTIHELIRAAENITPAEFDETSLPKWDATKLLQITGNVKHPLISFERDSGLLNVCSNLPDGKHEYLYASPDFAVGTLPAGRVLETHLDTAPGLDIQYVFVFLDEKKQKIRHVIHTANRNHVAQMPEQTAFVRFGWRISGAGETSIKYLLWGQRKLNLAYLLARSETLMLTNHYPQYDDLYRNGFVHSRVKAYQEHGVKVDVFRLRPNATLSYHEFQNTDVTTGSEDALHKLLDGGRYKNVLVHFLSPDMWDVLKCYPNLKITVWVHGAEIQPWHRRDHNFLNDRERSNAIQKSEIRMAFWSNLLFIPPKNLKLVFVSRYLAEVVMEDIGFRLPDETYVIIHNPIDTELFSYRPKPVEQRKKILSIRPYASRTYANDLSVAAILELSKRQFFKELEFRIIGDGILFDETLEPLRHFENVIIERRFLTRLEIAQLHRDYGVFLCPTRMDTQGVSRDEAMASGLVPITNAVAAVPEFLDDECGILARADNCTDIADGIARLYEKSGVFEYLSCQAAKRVRKQSAKASIVEADFMAFI